MAFDFSKIKAKKKEIGPIDPIELFQKLKVTDPNINDLWLAQGDALREWHRNRDTNDIGVVLNTGAGKTLVGLLIAQSLVNETKGSVLYACSSIQLVEQTTEKAKGYGLDVTTYYRGEYNNDLFRKGEAPCITTYQALFNGRSVFFREEIAAVVFDDAHAAEHLMRDHFSLQLEKNTFPEIFSEVVALFKEYHYKVGKAGSYDELASASIQHLFLIPPFEIQRQLSELRRILSTAKLSANKETMFAWEYLRDRIDLCCILITGTTITITPPFIPVRTLPYFSNETRRVYMSATLSASDAFARTFGCVPNKVITPTTTAGECERLIIIPAQTTKDIEDIDIAKMLIDKRKALILVPTYFRALKWQGMAETPNKDNVSGHVKEFKKNTGVPKLLLAARYDGMDLPGDTCRVMVIDDLPMGVGLLERYLWEYLGLSNTLRSAIASRIVQSFGRISRGMSDHGVVILTGNRLVDWLSTYRNLSTLPAFLQKQIALGLEISKSSQSIDDLCDAINQCLIRKEDWVKVYSEFMQNTDSRLQQEDTEKLAALAKSESDYAYYMWHRMYEKAAQCLSNSLENAFGVSTSTGAWHALWLGLAFELMKDSTSAIGLYKRSHSSQYTIPTYPSDADGSVRESIPIQIIEVDRQFEEKPDGKIYPPKRLYQDLAHLDGSGSAAQTEESLRALGQYLGLKASRPDKEYGTGPDVLWEIDNLPSLCLEVKTNKSGGNKYKKEEIGQLNDHVQWVKDNTGSGNIIASFVGPVVGSTPTANPPEDFRVVSLKEFNHLAQLLISAFRDIASTALPITLRSIVSDIFKERNLMWPDCLDHMEIKYLRDL